MTQQVAITNWTKSAQEDLETAALLLERKKYAYALFFMQLYLEKLLKAVIIRQTDTAPPATHNLWQLLKKTKLSDPPFPEMTFNEISSFNVEARYDVHKKTLYQKATYEFTERYYKTVTEIALWLKKYL